jgi:predicted amidohydrolase YtcJ
MKRRSFLTRVGALSAALAVDEEGAAARSAGPSQQAPVPAPRGDLALINARVVTLDPRQPQAEAVLVRGGRIAAVGSTTDVRAAAAGARVFDAGGRTVVPGFIDAHVHLEMASIASAYQVPVHTPPHTSLGTIAAALKQRIATTPAGRWVIGRGSYSLAADVPEKRMPTRIELDALSTEHPIMVFAGLHVVSLNSAAFKRLRLWDPAEAARLTWRNGRPRVGTIVHRDAASVPTGVATEIADLLYAAEAYPIAEVKAAIAIHARRLFVEKGITSVATVPSSGSNLVADQELRAAGELPVRLRFYPRVPMTTSVEALIEMGWRPGFGDDWLRFGGFKVFVDGTGSDGAGTQMEDLKWTKPELAEVMTKAQQHGLQVILHIVTRGGLRLAIDAVAEARAHHPGELRHRFEHVGFLDDPAQIRRIKALGVGIAVTQSTRGRGRPRRLLRTCIEAGIEPVATSDATGTVPEFSAWAGVASLMAPAGKGGVLPAGDELSFEEALSSWTSWAARSIFEERDKGTVTVGKLGDLAVLSSDPRERRGEDLFDIAVAATVLGGDVVFERHGR